MQKHRPHNLDPALDSARVVIVYRSTDEGLSHVGLGVTAHCVMRTLRQQGIWADAWGCRTPIELRNQLITAIAEARTRNEVAPSHVVISAPWISAPDVAALAKAFPDIVFAVLSHSNVGFLAADPGAVRILRETVDLQQNFHNVRVAGNATKFTDWASVAWGVRVWALPNLYDLSQTPRRPGHVWSGQRLRLGLFGASRPFKNALTAAAAAVELAVTHRVPTELHISTGRDEGAGQQALIELTENVPNLTLVRAGWLPWVEFRRLVSTMDLLFQVSYTESFNMVTADGVSQGVASVVSDAIDWAPPRWMATADDPRDVVRIAEQLLRDPRAAADGYDALENYVDVGLGHWKEFLLAR